MDDFIRPKKTPRPITKTNAALASEKNDYKEPDFVTPEVAADRDIVAAAYKDTGADPAVDETAIDPSEKAAKIKNNSQKRKFNLRMPRGKKEWIVTASVLVLLIGGGVSAYWFGFHKSPQPAAKVPVAKKAPPKPATTETSKLTGLQVPIGINAKPLTAVQIENSPDARPQAGLKDAGVIFEAIAEGGITRFNAIFQDSATDYVGPIRSLRPYYIDWFWPFDAAIAHVGGAPQALADVKSLGIKDLDQFFNSGTYDRITSRYAPHNVYTSIARLNDLEKSKGFTTTDYKGFDRKKETKAATPTAKSIDLDVSSYYYNVHYNYSSVDNAYFRNEGGEPHLDDKSGAQLEPKVVIAIVMGRGMSGDGEHTDYQTTGSGHMFVFQDGKVLEGTWSKASRQAQWAFTGTDGKAIAFNAGQTWITMVDSTGSVTYTP